MAFGDGAYASELGLGERPAWKTALQPQCAPDRDGRSPRDSRLYQGLEQPGSLFLSRLGRPCSGRLRLRFHAGVASGDYPFNLLPDSMPGPDGPHGDWSEGFDGGRRGDSQLFDCQGVGGLTPRPCDYVLSQISPPRRAGPGAPRSTCSLFNNHAVMALELAHSKDTMVDQPALQHVNEPVVAAGVGWQQEESGVDQIANGVEYDSLHDFAIEELEAHPDAMDDRRPGVEVEIGGIDRERGV